MTSGMLEKTVANRTRDGGTRGEHKIRPSRPDTRRRNVRRSRRSVASSVPVVQESVPTGANVGILIIGI